MELPSAPQAHRQGYGSLPTACVLSQVSINPSGMQQSMIDDEDPAHLAQVNRMLRYEQRTIMYRVP
jgi:hypothetical protein